MLRHGGSSYLEQTDATTGLVASAAALCREAGLQPQELDGILLDIGPGSYTGLRAAVTWAMMCRDFAGIPLCTTTSLELLALRGAQSMAAPPTEIHVALDARRGRAHHGRVAFCAALEPSPWSAPGGRTGESRGAATGRWALAEPPLACTLAELPGRIPTDATVLAPESMADTLAPHVPAAGLPGVERPLSAELLLHPQANLQRIGDRSTLEPLYLMGSYAAEP